jgi:hypothetical protein
MHIFRIEGCTEKEAQGAIRECIEAQIHLCSIEFMGTRKENLRLRKESIARFGQVRFDSKGNLAKTSTAPFESRRRKSATPDPASERAPLRGL